MPKNKKPNVISLVAYQSGDESEGSGNTDQESNGSEASDSETSKHSSCYEVKDTDGDKRAPVKRDRPSNEIDEEVSPSLEASDALKKARTADGSMDENSNTGSPAVKAMDVDVVMGTGEPDIEKSESNGSAVYETIDTNKFTLEKGFPPGCDKIRLPSAPQAPCSQSLQNKICQVVDRMERFNYNINEDIHRKKQFKNPCIYEKLIEVYEIDEFGSSFPNHVEDLKSEGYMFYDELDSVQRAEWARLEKAKKERTKIEMVSGTKKTK